MSRFLGTLLALTPLVSAAAQSGGGPVNQAPNPYRTIEGWARLPEGRAWGSTSAVEIDRDGRSIWVAERCSANSCAGSDLDPVLKFDSAGTLVKSFGAGLLLSPHGIFVDHQGNVWVTDCACTGTAQQRQTPGKGHQVYKFSPDGALLLTLGKAGGAREPEYFYQPNDVLVAPDGSIFVAEGHSSAATANARVLKFAPDGRFLKPSGPKVPGAAAWTSPTRWRWTPGVACSWETAATTGS
jgi:sugar lactone lactonase YvrE